MRIAAIIPAYNEERTVASVIRAVQDADVASEIIVVDDGSTDTTAAVAASVGAKVLSLPQNCGKAFAMKAGVGYTDAELLVYLDADLMGLCSDHVWQLVEPVRRREADMTVGVFRGGRWRTDLAQWIAPYLSGQRALRRWIMDEMEGVETMGYGIERALTHFARRNRLQVRHVELLGVTQVTKEEKAGLWKGLRARVRMYRELVRLPRLS